MAKKLFSGSSFSSQTWGHPASGLGDSQMLALERDALACSGIKAEGRCRTLALVVSYGVLATPRARIIRETLTAYFESLKILMPEQLISLNKAWHTALLHLRSYSRPSEHVRGLISNVISILLSAKWHPGLFNNVNWAQGLN